MIFIPERFRFYIYYTQTLLDYKDENIQLMQTNELVLRLYLLLYFSYADKGEAFNFGSLRILDSFSYSIYSDILIELKLRFLIQPRYIPKTNRAVNYRR